MKGKQTFFISILSIVSIFLFSIATFSTYAASILYGDVNNDEKVNILDATQIQLAIVGSATFDADTKLKGDVDGNGNIDINDVTWIQLYAAEAITVFPAEENTPATGTQPPTDADGYFNQVVKP